MTEATVAGVPSVADRLVETLIANGVEHLFLNPGTDTAPLLEAIARRSAADLPVPHVVLCLHEAVALAAAHGYYMVSGRPQVVVVHVDVGTQNLGAMLHNVWRSEIGVVLFAGRTPVISFGDVPGMRDLPVHWQQDVPDQDGIVRPYVKSIVDLRTPELLEQQVDRMFQLAQAVPPGATYLTAAREALMAPAAPVSAETRSRSVPAPYGPDENAIALAARLLVRSRRPLITTNRVGRNPEAVDALVALAERLGSPVVDRRERVNFPSGHPLYVPNPQAQKRALEQADLVLVIDSDVPWVPYRAQPNDAATIIHIGTDPLRAESPNWSFPSDLTIQSDPLRALRALDRAVREEITENREAWYDGPEQAVPRDQATSEPAGTERALLDARGIFEKLDELIDDDDIVVEEVTTNGDALREFLGRTIPGTLFQSGGSGLGWSLGASIGAKLAAPARRVIALVGDGAFMFNNPAAALWTARHENLALLVVILDNGGYAASRKPIVDLYPHGAYVDSDPVGTQFGIRPDFSALAAASGFEAVTVSTREELEPALRAALASVDQGRSTAVTVRITSPWLPERR